MSGVTNNGSIVSYTISTSGFVLTNLGTIGSSAVAGVTVSSSGDTVVNAGTIAGTGFGVTASQYLTLTNSGSGALIQGGGVGLQLNGGGALANLSGGTVAGYDGISLGGPSTVTNAAQATIEATGLPGFGLFATGVATIENAGLIVGGRNAGVYMKGGGSFTNQASGTVTASAALEMVGGSAVNYGTLESTTAAPFHQGVDLNGVSSLTNQSGGWISGYFGVAAGTNESVLNFGTIFAGYGLGAQRGVQLFAGGSLTNAAGGTIAGETGVWGTGSASVVNDGKIGGALSGTGVYLHGGSLTNQSDGSIAAATGVRLIAGTLLNAGRIAGPGTGVYGSSASFVTNQAQATISAAFGVELGGYSTLQNAGHIVGTITGLDAGTGSVATNQAQATMTAALGVMLSGHATLLNDGVVAGSSESGVVIAGYGNVTNQADGTITGATAGIDIYRVASFYYDSYTHTFYPEGYAPGLGRVTNAGTISGGYGILVQHGAATVKDSGVIAGSTAAVAFAAGYASRLVLYPGASLSGAVLGGSGVLELASSASAGTLTGFGTEISGFSSVVVDPGADWVVNGSNTLSPGTTLVDGGTLQITGLLQFASGSPSELVFNPASSIVGTISSGNAAGSDINSVLELTSGSTTGTLSGASVQNFNQIIVESGADWLLDPSTLAFGVTLTNQGTIGAIGGTSVVFQPGAGNRVVLYGGAEFLGTVDGSNPLGSGNASILELGGYQPSTLNGLGTRYLDFSQIAVDNNATWSLGATLAAGTTLTDAGYITGTPSVVFAAGAGNRLVMDSGAKIAGTVDGGNAIGGGNVSTLELAAGSGRGYLSGIGTQITDFAQITVDAYAYWALSNTNTIASGVTLSVAGVLANQGTLFGNVALPGGTLLNQYGTIAGVVTGDATVVNSGIILGSGGTAVSLSSGGDVVALYPTGTFGGSVYGGGTGTLQLRGSTQGTLSGFGTRYTGFTQVAVAAYANWNLNGTTLTAGTTLTNTGTIAGNVSFASGAGDRLIDQAGTFTGTINGGNAIGSSTPTTLELASGYRGHSATLTNLGSQLINFGFVTVDAGSYWTMDGVNTVAAGSTLLDSGKLSNFGTVFGNITLDGSTTEAGLSNDGSVRGSVIGANLYANLYNGVGSTIVNVAGAGVSFAAGGYIQSYGTHALISGTSYGIVMAGTPGRIDNKLLSTIKGGTAGVALGAGDTLNNNGTILGANGVLLQGSGAFVIYNQYKGSIVGGTNGITQQGSGSVTITNDGYIKGGSNAVLLQPGSADLVQFYPTAHFVGVVDGGNVIGGAAVSTLELQAQFSASTPTGTISGIGTTFVDFGQVAVDAKARWALKGSNSIASLTNLGTLVLNGGSTSVGTLTGNGILELSGGVTLDVSGTAAAAQYVSFGGAGVVRLDNPSNFSAFIGYISTGDTIDLRGVSPASVQYNSGVVSFIGAGDVPGAFDVDFVAGKGLAPVTGDGAGGTDLTAMCFCAGTRIATANGETAVEHLRVGDMVLTAGGAVRPIVWIGVGQVLATRGQRGAATPVIVRRGALAHNVPHRNLRVTKGHSFLLDGVLIPVEFLVNHRSILWDDDAQEVTIYHIELETHDVLIADGAAAESYRDDGNRWLFRNANEGWDQPPKPPCAPVLIGGPAVDAVWRRLLGRARSRPIPTTTDPDLHLLADGRRVDGVPIGSLRVFSLDRVPHDLRIVSRAAALQELGVARDPRRLGVAIRRITVAQGLRLRVLEADDARLGAGFHACETDSRTSEAFRWTDGDAALPGAVFDGWDGAVTVELQLTGSTQYPAECLDRRAA